jgi:hypothetical protein
MNMALNKPYPNSTPSHKNPLEQQRENQGSKLLGTLDMGRNDTQRQKIKI